MLIIPIQNKPDWSRPPLITMALILLNLLVFVFYQGKDGDVLDRAAEIYRTNNLLDIERPYYRDYVQEADPAALADWPAEDILLADEQLFWTILFDRSFDAYLADRWRAGAIADTEANNEWREHRQAFETERNRLSSVEAGLTPAEAKPWTFVTSMFMHGGWDHLVGNMIFLFLFGFTLEGALRPRAYLGMYLASGIASGLLFVAVSRGSMIPLVGASGAVSGLMGMYLCLYRLRKIRFFYSLLFYFGEFRAPAIFILPLWLGKELYGHFFIDSNVAYWAHIGGLVTGAGLMLLAPASQRAFVAEESQEAQRHELTQGLKKVQQAMTQLDRDGALAQARALCREFPADSRPWVTLIELAQIQPRQKAYHQAVFDFLKQFASDNTAFSEWAPQADEVLQSYRQAAPRMPALNGNLCLALARRYWREGDRHKAENFLKMAARKGANRPATIHLLTDVQRYYETRRQKARAESYGAIIRQLRSATPPKASTVVE